MVSSVLHEYARSVARVGDSGFFKGKLIKASSGASTRIRGMSANKNLTLTVEQTDGFRKDDTFRYIDLQEGDSFFIASRVTLTRTGPNSYHLMGGEQAIVTAPTKVRVSR